MTDRELLEFAAKAIGIVGKYREGNKNLYQGIRYGLGYEQDLWCPLDDDGDALRLAVKLRLPIRDGFNGTVETGNTQSGYPIWEMYEPDPCAATRRAIVRAAAEIGRNMK